ncbi:uncharacterized protein MELLADRAFT_94488 [Melampsora larici-populina 98AG31]|uniref:21S rRNA pseudouridine(2819) synthase n=1 Tax=Melampsora larici-populina (strain 98AG31 / pathotype 3-4-7) TaxID=747676 RepID=F4RBL4_MELLP|nr:uncharacterized protein MELLADRAFT_94488 [Melampsora larici-populina 98AG31]EGG10122.1 hypothetical protein MELLADRAFT_94488 [Melampsora larici-populina 98AG31]
MASIVFPPFRSTCRWFSVKTAARAVVPAKSIPPVDLQDTASKPPSPTASSRLPRSQIKRAKIAEEKLVHHLKAKEELENRLRASFRPPEILYDDEKVLVINKPAGCALQAEEGSEAFIRWNLIHDHFTNIYGKLYLVQRLDKSTSGPLILARSSSVARTIGTQFKQSTIKKRYLALVQFLPTKRGPIQEATTQGKVLCRMRNRSDKMVIAEANRTGPDCKRAETDWKLVTATSTHAIVSLLPTTGRKHQLRLVCSRFLSAPIVGDFKYDFRYLSDKSQKCIEDFLKRESDSRIMLHSSQIEFKLYRKEEPKQITIKVRAPFPEDFRILCDQLDLATEDLRH